ncbi:DegT/DnrJ/EryC1/StrS family aminotransferase [Flavobacterium sp. N502536]|uniref:DegT/DnrJ/EryC1/StrS family aminotransferase n=1 Tax=Flavobacterium sp. N502536 TaxID=2986837 RepID=UPI0022224F90|nr:DegT/DnrJ/EryC1/StrS aminotransferase family protein [Flavobacterium sp. N502536]
MIPIYKPYMPDKIDSEVSSILYSGQLGYGKYGKQFESELRKFIGSEYILSVSSYNIAMLIVLSTLGLNKGDEVIASPVSCLASNQPFAVKGLKVVWVDINPETGSMCPDDLKAKITNKTKAIFHNHFCGYLGNIDEINAIGNSFGIPVIDDGIEAFGSEYKGKKIGNLGTDITVFSFQTVRLPNTIDGGAIVFKDKELYEKALLIRDYGIDRAIFRTDNGEINPKCDISLEGYGGLMSELNSFLGAKQMDDIEDLLARQKKNALVWDQKIMNMENFYSLKLVENAIPNYWVYGILCENKEVAINYFKDNGFYATGVHINNNVYSVFNNKDSLKGVNEFMNRFLAIPSGWWFENKLL